MVRPAGAVEDIAMNPSQRPYIVLEAIVGVVLLAVLIFVLGG